MSETSQAKELLSMCNAALVGGADFLTVWNTVLKDHSLLLGLPVQVTLGGDPQLRIQLENGQALQFRGGAVVLD